MNNIPIYWFLVSTSNHTCRAYYYVHARRGIKLTGRRIKLIKIQNNDIIILYYCPVYYYRIEIKRIFYIIMI